MKQFSKVIITTMIFAGTLPLAYAATQSINPKIALVKAMQQDLLVERNGSMQSIKTYYAPKFTLNNNHFSYNDISKRLDNFYAHTKRYQVHYHYFTVSGNNVSWFADEDTVDAAGHHHQRQVLELAVVKNKHITSLYKAGR